MQCPIEMQGSQKWAGDGWDYILLDLVTMITKQNMYICILPMK